MKSATVNMLLKSPVFIQNLALSIYGLKIQRTRYGGEYKYYLNNVSSHLNSTQAELDKYVESVLKKTISTAVENVPYYRELFRKNGIDVKIINSIEDLQKIPVLEKDPLRKTPEKFINEQYAKDKLQVIHTTGTTGTPLKIYCDSKSRQLNYAFYDRFLGNVGINYKGKRATFGGRIIVPTGQKSPPFWRYSYFQRNLLFSSYHLTDENIPYYIDKLHKFRPDFIDAYPSSLFAIASYAERHNISLENITKGITTSAETLTPVQRRIIESTFNVPIFDQYGAAEMCLFVGQCKNGNYHINTDYGIIELLKEDGTNAMPGEEGEVICTGFVNFAMPLIRYRIGDRGLISKKQCGCGSLFPVMEKILGRIDDVIVTPDGRKVGRLSPVFKGFPVKEVQYVQKVKDSVEVLLIKDNGYSGETEKHVLEELRKRLGSQISIQLKYVHNIPRRQGGKLRSVISYVR